MRKDKVRVTGYDPAWAEAFENQRGAVESVLRARLSFPIEHIGSTAVPGLSAKPIIDMLAVVQDSAVVAPALARLAVISWVHAPEPDDLKHAKWSLCHPNAEYRSHHLHVVEYDSADWRDWLLFRDFLRSHPDAVRRYGELKTELASRDIDRIDYRAAKAAPIHALMEQARAWSCAS